MALEPIETDVAAGDLCNQAKTETKSAAPKSYMVLCLYGGTPSKYDFEFISIQDLVTPYTTSIDHERCLYWEPPSRFHRSPVYPKPSDDYDLSCSKYQSSEKESNPYTAMSFMYSKSNRCLYAVGGYPPVGSSTSLMISPPPHLPNDVFCIPLMGNFQGESYSRANVLRETSMKTTKLFPLIEEIGRSLYVLSAAPCDDTKSAFEVFNLDNKADGWNRLPPPHFIQCYKRPYLGPYRYSYFVVDNKLFVSDGVYSCVFDTKVGWGKCDMFSADEFSLGKKPDLALPNGCGPGFPFRSKAVLWKDRIFLCLVRKSGPPVAAFQVSLDYKHANNVLLSFDREFWKSEDLHSILHSIVHLGDDHIAFVIHDDSVLEWPITILTFKLSNVDGGALHAEFKSERQCRGSGPDYRFAYCFGFLV